MLNEYLLHPTLTEPHLPIIWQMVWIVVGCLFAGAVHDYFSGMTSIRHDGESVSEIIDIVAAIGTLGTFIAFRSKIKISSE